MIHYLSVDAIVRINAAQDGNVGVRDQEGVEASAARPQSGFGDHETFPDIWTKAAAYAHGFAATQHFFDGNKRTAWLAANMFLEANGHELPYVSDIAAEAFINAVALDAWKADGPDGTITKAAEWFQSTYWNQRRGPAQHPKLEFAFLAQAVSTHDGGFFSTINAGIATMGATTFPMTRPIGIATRVHFDESDVGEEHVVSVHILPANDDTAPVTFGQDNGYTLEPPVRGGHAEQLGGLMPVMVTAQQVVTFPSPGSYSVLIGFDSRLAAILPLQIISITETPDSLPLGAGPL